MQVPGNLLVMVNPKLSVPDELHIPVSFDGLPSLLHDLTDLGIEGVHVTAVLPEKANESRSYVVSLTKGEVFSLLNQHALDLVTKKYT